jgi:DNA oxidative demethylase
MRNGQKFNLSMSNCGKFGWISDLKGYRYVETHPVTGKPWPKMPMTIKTIAISLAEEAGFTSFKLDACLINYYVGSDRLGLHQDKDELDFAQPIVSISLGDSASFIFGGLKKTDPVTKYKLKSGDCVVFGDEDRLNYHGIKKIFPGTSNLIPNGGRFNLTLRQVY